jgi:hypothetical protein
MYSSNRRTCSTPCKLSQQAGKLATCDPPGSKNACQLGSFCRSHSLPSPPSGALIHHNYYCDCHASLMQIDLAYGTDYTDLLGCSSTAKRRCQRFIGCE